MNDKYKFDVVIIGAGVIGLAIAERLKNSYKNVLVLEKEKKFGQHISSRNSEVIHSGIYNPTDSLKSQLCIKGNRLLYEFFKIHPINSNFHVIFLLYLLEPNQYFFFWLQILCQKLLR